MTTTINLSKSLSYAFNRQYDIRIKTNRPSNMESVTLDIFNNIVFDDNYYKPTWDEVVYWEPLSDLLNLSRPNFGSEFLVESY